MSGITLINTLQFLLNNNPPVLRMTDTTNYGGAGAAHADTIIGLLQVYDPSGGLLYQSSQYGQSVPTLGDLYPYAASSPVTLFDIQLPIDPTTEFPLLGTYTLNYQVYVHQASGTTLNGTYNVSTTFTVNTVIPKVDVDCVVDCISGFISAADNTNYGNYTSLSRVFKLFYPASLGLSPEVSSLPSVMAALYTTPKDETYVAQVTTTVSYILNNVTVTYVVSGSVGQRVVCTQSLCDVSCQINKLQDQYFEALCSNMSLANQLEKQLFQITQLMVMINTSIDCGQTKRVNGLLDRIYKIGRFSENGCGCGCDDDGLPQLIVGRAGNPTSNTYSSSGSNGILVTSITSGNQTSFGVKINDGLYNVLSGLTKTVLVPGSGVGITSAVSADGGTTTYTITAQISGATVDMSQVTGLTAALAAKQSTTLTNAHILVGNGSNVATDVAVSGDVTLSNTGAIAVTKINGVALGSTAATSGNILIGSGTTWVTNPISGDATLSSTGALTLANTAVTPSTYTSVTVDSKGRVTSGTNPGFITGNQTITASGDVSGSGTTSITLSIGSNKITNGMLQANSVATANIQNGAVGTTQIANNAITTGLIANGAVGTTQLANNAVTVANLTADLQAGFFNIGASFETSEQGTLTFYHPFLDSIVVAKVVMVVSKTLAAGEPGTIQFASSTGNMGAPVSIPLSSAQGYVPIAFIPGSNMTVATTTAFSLTTNKPTAGGKVLCTVYYTRS